VFGFFSERDILGVMEGIDSGDESLFSDEPPFNFGDLDDEGQEIDDMFRSVGWEEVIPPTLDNDDEFEVLPGHMVDAAVGGAPPAARAAVERLQVAVIGGEDAAHGCAVCKDGIVQGELATRLPCAHFYHGDCIGPWLAIRNSCPVCRYELPTDDPDYEKQRARRCSAGASVGSPMHI
jgi:coenzyme F420-reducing hydrogenase gamma subunit